MSSRLARGLIVVLSAAATVLAVALLAAGCWVALHDGFGRGDLVALAFWSLPFAGVIGMLSVVARTSERLGARSLRVALAAVVGALLGWAWTVSMAQMMGPWFGTFSFPVLPILSASGASTLALFAASRPRSLTTTAR